MNVHSTKHACTGIIQSEMYLLTTSMYVYTYCDCMRQWWYDTFAISGCVCCEYVDCLYIVSTYEHQCNASGGLRTIT